MAREFGVFLLVELLMTFGDLWFLGVFAWRFGGFWVLAFGFGLGLVLVVVCWVLWIF